VSAEILTLLTKISGDIGEVKGTLNGLKGTIESHVQQDQSIQQQMFARLGTIEVAQATTVGKGLAFKSVLTGVGAAIGVVGHIAKMKFWH
jgi:hypothetical protein